MGWTDQHVCEPVELQGGDGVDFAMHEVDFLWLWSVTTIRSMKEQEQTSESSSKSAVKSGKSVVSRPLSKGQR
jgi:hypothetical protein